MRRITIPSLPFLLIATFVLAFSLPTRRASAEDLAAFARCISDRGATFYGAHWCPYCEKQKAAFGRSAYLLPYVECYKAGTRKKLSRCRDVESFPTWHFSDGTVQRGLQSLEKLATLTGCRLQ